jgi:WD40 repeat protein
MLSGSANRQALTISTRTFQLYWVSALRIRSRPHFQYLYSGSRELLLSHTHQLIMAGPEVHHLFHHPIADHSFSADRKTLAVARDINVELYSKSGNNFTLQDELKGHDKTVTGVDIAPASGMIVTCSQGALPFFRLPNRGEI